MPSSQSKSKKLPNFLPEEDKQLAKSWALISRDPITANQQGRDDFFIRIADDYNKFTPGPQRDANGLQNRLAFLLFFFFFVLSNHALPCYLDGRRFRNQLSSSR
jgi:hypothetical protein